MQNNNEILKQLRNRFEEVAFAKDDKNIGKALEKAYADMSRRAQGHNSEIKKASLDYLDEIKFEDVIIGKKTFSNQKEFNNWHKNVCINLCKTMSDNGFKGTIGRAQKVVNMAFKYASFIPDCNLDKTKHYCHLTLDGYTLDWYKQKVNDKWKKTEWSKLDNYDDYMTIQNNIIEYLKKPQNYSLGINELEGTKTVELPKIPFEAEFIIWEGEKVRKTFTELIKSLSLYFEGKDDKPYTSWKNLDEWILGDAFSNYMNNLLSQNIK